MSRGTRIREMTRTHLDSILSQCRVLLDGLLDRSILRDLEKREADDLRHVAESLAAAFV
jgi:hypothetical protein